MLVAEALKLFLEEQLVPYDCTISIAENAVAYNVGRGAIATNPKIAQMIAKYQHKIGESAGHIDIIANLNKPHYPFRGNIVVTLVLCITTCKLQTNIYAVGWNANREMLRTVSSPNFCNDLNNPFALDQIVRHLQRYRRWLTQEYTPYDHAVGTFVATLPK